LVIFLILIKALLTIRIVRLFIAFSVSGRSGRARIGRTNLSGVLETILA